VTPASLPLIRAHRKSALEAGDFVKGRLLDLTPSQQYVLSRMRDGSQYIEGRRYKIVSVDESGDFVALRDNRA
jgi:hypothetical protein